MRQTTLVFVFSEKGKILLAMKKRGFWAGKYNGAGGKVEAWEKIIEAASRELEEETGVKISTKKLEARGILHFYFDDKSEWDQDVSIFVAKDYTGGYVETEEMKPEWFDTEDIPFEDMWEDDPYWLPRVIEGESVEFDFYFAKDGSLRKFTEIMK